MSLSVRTSAWACDDIDRLKEYRKAALYCMNLVGDSAYG